MYSDNYVRDLKNPDITTISEDCYKKAEAVLDSIKSVSIISRAPIYVIDLYRGRVVFAPQSLCLFCGYSVEEITMMGYDFYKHIIPKEELVLIEELRAKAREFILQERTFADKSYCIEFDFHMKVGEKERLFHHCTVPLLKTDDGKVWMVLCSLFPSSQKKTGNAILRKNGEKEYFQYDFKLKNWEKKKTVCLTETEKQIVILSAKGYNGRKIAEMTFKSHETIKTYKQKLFRKIEVTSIAEAITYCSNHRLL